MMVLSFNAMSSNKVSGPQHHRSFLPHYCKQEGWALFAKPEEEAVEKEAVEEGRHSVSKTVHTVTSTP
ncbi:hypothetical protein ATANTOWER_020238 [Ataeniobius toweri]|uniref:Uncharacterized protein n=1 Tax=Ataeniobius toweri TaxID=208326 RepID=A0ABU7BUK4_9TELE|nr:hypothetical protein [Ataeniobius toweri]